MGAVRLGNPYLQFAGILVFFPLAYFVAKWVGLNGLKGIGLFFHKGWAKNFFLSFAIGFCFWLTTFLIMFLEGELEFIGFKGPTEVIMPVLLVFVGYLIGSLVNDLIVRGYVINFLKNKLPIGWVLAISILIYAFEDAWNAGFSLSNTIFSILLGLSLTFVFYKTGSIWADTGMHYGLNIAYGLFFGLVGNSESAIIRVKEIGEESLLTQSLYYIIPALMFIFVLWAIRFYKNSSNSMKNVPFSA